jgi:DNA repair exonuclease SbcCD nuclease subunit
MANIAITADIHLGLTGRLQDTIYALKTIRAYCQLAKVDMVLILGDLFHDRKYLEIDVLNEAAEFFDESKTKFGQTWVVFPGNHDMYLRYSWKCNSLDPLNDKLVVINGIKELIIDGRHFHILPYITQESVYNKILAELVLKADQETVLLTHIGVRGATFNTCFTQASDSNISFASTPYRAVFTGHYHNRQSVGDKVFYPGSPIPFKHDEGGIPHGFIILDTNTMEQKFVNIQKAGLKFFPESTPPPNFYTIIHTDVNSTDHEVIKNNHIRVVLNETIAENEKENIRLILQNHNPKSIKFITPIEKITQTKQEIKVYGISDYFDRWIKKDKNFKDLDERLILRLNQEIIQVGDEQYLSEQEEIE